MLDMGHTYTHINWGGKYRFKKLGESYYITIVEYSTKKLPMAQQEMGWEDGIAFHEKDFLIYFTIIN